MQRKEWTFDYTAAKLSDCSVEKKSFHADKMRYWKEKKAEVMAEVKESGLDVQESLATTANNDVNPIFYSGGPKVVVRNDLQEKLTECYRKIKEHGAMVGEYNGWYQVLSANPEVRLSLHHDDWLYFFGGARDAT